MINIILSVRIYSYHMPDFAFGHSILELKCFYIDTVTPAVEEKPIS